MGPRLVRELTRTTFETVGARESFFKGPAADEPLGQMPRARVSNWKSDAIVKGDRRESRFPLQAWTATEGDP